MTNPTVKPGTRCECSGGGCLCGKLGHCPNQPAHPFRVYHEDAGRDTGVAYRHSIPVTLCAFCYARRVEVQS